MNLKETWWKEAVVYQIYPRSFNDSNDDGIGDLNGITEKLDYLSELGVTIVWVCPMYKSPNIDNGYDVSDYQEIMEEMGTMADFDRLLEELHKRGMRLIIDLVLNHTSDQHPWFLESKSSKDNPKRDWYVWRDQQTNWESIFGGPAWTFDPKTEQYYLHIYTKNQVDLNWENKDMRESIYEMIRWWVAKGVDGFRVDAINHLKKDYSDMPNPQHLPYVPAWEKFTEVEGLQDILTELRDQAFKNNDIVTIGEANSVKSHNMEKWISEHDGKFNMIFHLEAHKPVDSNGVDNDLNVEDLKEVLNRWQQATHGIAWNSLYIENHDRPRTVSIWGNDQKYWYESATALGCMYFFMQGTPFIYQGQEIGMTNAPFDDIDMYHDIETKNIYRYKYKQGVPHEEVMHVIKKISRDHARTPMQWNNQDFAGFSKATPWLGINPNYQWLNVEAQKDDPSSIWSFYKKMIHLRQNWKVLVYGTTELADSGCPYVYAYIREDQYTKMLIASNLSEKTCAWNSPYDAELFLSNYEERAKGILQPYETCVYFLKKEIY
ncbi:Alpha-glucosidase [Planococcus halocryophilus Or1]|uniref:Alpha-amylase n=1 Tax=Planococcus halocryophilus TaxID=1215089 RepID=A0A1C7DVB3_9BACL|nr:alpha-glucosidase [Planococcus halocryophilus]ANU15385.1 glucohydrolase [Planococcus halocryophilus]EMF47750.1 Alpha-glucosidase [Planococcus halocryophilus Or1]